MISLAYKPSFIRQLNKLEKGLISECLEKIELLKYEKNHTQLKVHRLHGKLSGLYSFSINYKFRIVFEYETKQSIVLLAIGSHDIYK